VPRIVELTTYPVKGCAGFPLTRASLTGAGLAHDRSFMVVDEQGVFRSQRHDPRLAVVHPAVDKDGGLLTLRAAGAADLAVEVDRTSPRVDVEMFGTAYRAIDQGEPPARWLTEVLGGPSRLVRVPPEHDRATDGLIPGSCGFADSGAVHLLSRSSLAALNRRVGGGGRVPMTRFRPNIVVDGWDEPHMEDAARTLILGGVELGYAKPAIRCAVTLVDQSSGVRAGPEPLRTLGAYRRSAKGGVMFGAKYSVVRTGELSLGDAVIVTAWGDVTR